MARVVSIQFGYAGKIYDFLCGALELQSGNQVIVETEKGRGIATVVREPRDVTDSDLFAGMKSVLRAATPDDVESAQRHKTREKDAFVYCTRKIEERGMEMKLVRAEYLFDGSKVIFYFTAEGRVDFRDLVKDLAYAFHTRIEMRQIGVRDEAKMVGGIGICGRELCCSSFLRDFAPVSVKMAKEQNLALNPTKISGQCGRLLCCLGYEYDTYSSLRKSLPKCGKYVQCGEGCGEVVKQNILQGTVTLKTDDHRELIVKGDELRPDQILEKPRKPQPKELTEQQVAQQAAAQVQQQQKQQRDAKQQQKQQNRRQDKKHKGRDKEKP